MDPMISLERVRKSYRGKAVLQPSSLSVLPGETHILAGASGSGKSTLLRIAIGLVSPDAGTVRLAGETLSRENAARLRHSIGYVIQEGGLFPHLSAADNVTLVARHLGWSQKRIHQRLEELE